MAENTYAELLLPGESKRRESREILSFRPRNMKTKNDSNNSCGSPVEDGGQGQKRQRALSDAATATSLLEPSTVAQISMGDGNAEKGDEKKGLTALAALEKISLHLTNNKKFSKAIRLLNQLVDSSMDETNGDVFFLHLSSLMKNCPLDRDITSSEYSQAYIDIIGVYRSKKENITCQNYLYQLETFYTLVCLRAALATDDSFTYNKACIELKAIITLIQRKNDIEMSSSSSGNVVTANSELNSISAEDISNRENAIFVCLDTAFRIYHWSWAKQPCDSIYACAAEGRLHFSDSSRDALDALTMAITAAQRKDTSWSGPHTIRTYNSTSHPLHTKNVGILR